ncbi:MAG TPA: FAD-binding oxidoreductase [candidate division Zixibacteria bacterium]|nr:FAD-binding oxidoreductase [candidate division Zixibacteria bacterium]MDD4918459.1 FAD-binding oxidoreductase [candidate division Zixibacteria bacterium]MDM7971786.1 FAD-binding oxidoreductase [candidate division Zixibacteria bacterium]HOD66692.1 FAD-binding oxidoreductase [candidate division Zixibacteria bacterium]HPC11218.1 FAD-binding oxidoreductase [candidate division Zixibacteria bacterium]
MKKARPTEARGGRAAAPSAPLESLAGSLRGTLIRPGDSRYDAARSVWNSMIDRTPAAIVQAADSADVRHTVRFAREHRLPLSIRGAGHNIAGNAVCDDGLTLDLSGLKAVQVEPAARRAWVGAGATLGDFDRAAQDFGLATPLGINSTTGIAGLTLGGGFGWLTRKYGTAADNLRGAEVVLADGSLVRASDTEHPDLFWAIRGGGGNFGVVTRFEFDLHPVGPNVYSGLVVYPHAEAKAVLRQYRDYVAELTDESACWLVLRPAPPVPFVPAEKHGQNVLVVIFFHAGDPEAGRRAAEPLRHLGRPVGEALGVQPYTGWQSAFDPLMTAGARNYWKTHNFTALPDALLDVLVRLADRVPSPECEVFLGQLGGAAARIPRETIAYPHRDADFVLNVHARWRAAEDDERCIAWARELFRATEPFATGGAYVNFVTADESDRIKGIFGANYDRLRRVKRAYDPDNLFRMNHNIAPGR